MTEAAAGIIIYADTGDVRQISEVFETLDGVVYKGRWQSRTLNPKDTLAHYTLVNVWLRYQVPLDNSVEIRYTANGGVSWTDWFTVDLAAATDIVWIAPDPITGRDVRFELNLLDSDTEIIGFRAEVAERSPFA